MSRRTGAGSVLVGAGATTLGAGAGDAGAVGCALPSSSPICTGAAFDGVSFFSVSGTALCEDVLETFDGAGGGKTSVCVAGEVFKGVEEGAEKTAAGPPPA